MLIDLDHFKKVNDTYGHPVGDQVLVRLVELLQESVRNEDLVARYGGEEFIAFFCDVDARTCQVIADKIRSRVEAQFIPPLLVTVSIGAASGPLGLTVDQDLAGLIAQADTRLVEARRQGKEPGE